MAPVKSPIKPEKITPPNLHYLFILVILVPCNPRPPISPIWLKKKA